VLDVHDGPVQNIFAALGQLSVVRRHVADDPDAAPALNTAIRLLEASLDSIRDVLTTFHAPEFAKLTLSQLVEELGVQHETLTGEPVVIQTDEGLPQVPLVIKIALFRILQEALSNIRRHAGAPDATVRLLRQDGSLCLEIEDRGKGFSPPPLVGPQATEKPIHIGLRGMRERAVTVNGELSVQSRPGVGTCVRVEIPLDE
jgi:signal transduction histidine kinase